MKPVQFFSPTQIAHLCLKSRNYIAERGREKRNLIGRRFKGGKVEARFSFTVNNFLAPEWIFPIFTST